jgi:hypothetical protein
LDLIDQISILLRRMEGNQGQAESYPEVLRHLVGARKGVRAAKPANGAPRVIERQYAVDLVFTKLTEWHFVNLGNQSDKSDCLNLSRFTLAQTAWW